MLITALYRTKDVTLDTLILGIHIKPLALTLNAPSSSVTLTPRKHNNKGPLHIILTPADFF